MSRLKIRWAEVEYQPDIQSPKPVVPLGVVVMVALDDGKTPAWLIVGREPNPDNLPAVLKDVGPLGRSQLIGWGTSIARDILEGQGEGRRHL